MLSFHANLFALPPDTVSGPTHELRGVALPSLVAGDGGPPRFTHTMPVTFEALQQRLLELERCDCEPDGFFLLSGREGEVFWRLNGHLNELGDAIHRVELNGDCPVAVLDGVLGALGWPASPLAFELVREGATLLEADFRRYAVADPG